jgi:hypothetical protein
MAKRFHFWTNGIATVLESPGLAQVLERRTDLGTVVEQNADTHAWFHIPITTPTVIEDDTLIYLRKIYLRAKVYKNAQVDRIHIRCGTDLIIDLDVTFIGTQAIEATYDVTDQMMGNRTQAGLAMSIHVKFLPGTPRGRIEFQCAGAVFSGAMHP